MSSDTTKSPQFSGSLAATRPPSLAPQRLSYPRQRAIKACRLCRTRRTKCDNKKPACSSCERLGAECVAGDGRDYSVMDPSTLKILDRIDDLEKLLRSLQSPKEAQTKFSPGLPRTESAAPPLRISTEEILSWSVFQSRYDSRRDIKRIIQSTPSTIDASPLSVDRFTTLGEFEPASGKQLLENFLRIVHVKNPMLEEGKIRQSVHRMSLDGPTWDAHSCLALLICALGSIASPFTMGSNTSPDPRSMTVAQSYFNAAQKRLGTVLGSGGILEAQCFFYSGVYLMCTLQPVKAWRLFIQALACCQEFECASEPFRGSSSEAPFVRERLPAEECVYWSCWKSERELRLALDLADFSCDNLYYPLLFPTPPASVTGYEASSWYFYLSEISLRRLENRVREEINSALELDGDSSLNALIKSVAAFEELADDWVRSLHPIMCIDTPQEDDDVLKFILRGQFLDLWEVIYWPFLEALINSRTTVHAVEAFARKSLEIGIQRIQINKPGFHHRHHGTWLMLLSCTRSALALLAVAYCAEAAPLLPNGWRDAVIDTMELLRFWQDEVGDVSDRLQILEELFGNL